MSPHPPKLIRFLSGFLAVGIAVRLVSGLLLSNSEPRLSILFWQHAAGVGVIFLLLRRPQKDLAIFFMGIEFLVLATRLVWLFGTAPLFHIHALVLAPVALLFTNFSRRRRAVFVVMPMVLTLIVAMIPRHHAPTFALSSHATELWSLLNLALFMSACMGIILYQIQALEEQTDKAENLASQRSRLIADLSHEWKNPLASILAKAQLTLSRPRESDAYREALALCERNARHLNSLTLRMINYLQAEQDQLAPELEEVDLPLLLRKLFEDLTPLVKAADFQLDLSCPQTLTLRTDPLLLHLILRNLISNALQHATGGTRIQITADPGPPLRITVEDNGPGLPPLQTQEIFEPFVRGDSARRREGGSVGLGLSIARERAGTLGMELTAYNRSGGGACFELKEE